MSGPQISLRDDVVIKKRQWQLAAVDYDDWHPKKKKSILITSLKYGKDVGDIGSTFLNNDNSIITSAK